ncbi:MAG: hypothetical protein DCC55_40055, partial [Chloroflexi bacterium]
YEAEVLPSGLIYLELTMGGWGVLVIEEKVKRKQMCVCYLLFNAQGMAVPEPDIRFYLDERSYWIPYVIHCHTLGSRYVGQVEPGTGELLITGEADQETLAAYADCWAKMLRAQGWIGGAKKTITQPQEWLEEDAPYMPPTVEELWDWVDEYGQCTATDGCWVAPSGVCEHGHRSWLLEWGLI